MLREGLAALQRELAAQQQLAAKLRRLQAPHAARQRVASSRAAAARALAAGAVRQLAAERRTRATYEPQARAAAEQLRQAQAKLKKLASDHEQLGQRCAELEGRAQRGDSLVPKLEERRLAAECEKKRLAEQLARLTAQCGEQGRLVELLQANEACLKKEAEGLRAAAQQQGQRATGLAQQAAALTRDKAALLRQLEEAEMALRSSHTTATRLLHAAGSLEEEKRQLEQELCVTSAAAVTALNDLAAATDDGADAHDASRHPDAGLTSGGADHEQLKQYDATDDCSGDGGAGGSGVGAKAERIAELQSALAAVVAERDALRAGQGSYQQALRQLDEARAQALSLHEQLFQVQQERLNLEVVASAASHAGDELRQLKHAHQRAMAEAVARVASLKSELAAAREHEEALRDEVDGLRRQLEATSLAAEASDEERSELARRLAEAQVRRRGAEFLRATSSRRVQKAAQLPGIGEGLVITAERNQRFYPCLSDNTCRLFVCLCAAEAPGGACV